MTLTNHHPRNQWMGNCASDVEETMTLAYYGKSHQRKGTLLLVALLAIIGAIALAVSTGGKLPVAAEDCPPQSLSAPEGATSEECDEQSDDEDEDEQGIVPQAPAQGSGAHGQQNGGGQAQQNGQDAFITISDFVCVDGGALVHVVVPHSDPTSGATLSIAYKVDGAASSSGALSDDNTNNAILDYTFTIMGTGSIEVTGLTLSDGSATWTKGTQGGPIECGVTVTVYKDFQGDGSAEASVDIYVNDTPEFTLGDGGSDSRSRRISPLVGTSSA
jgi:hypothetical protein